MKVGLALRGQFYTRRAIYFRTLYESTSVLPEVHVYFRTKVGGFAKSLCDTLCQRSKEVELTLNGRMSCLTAFSPHSLTDRIFPSAFFLSSA